ncbi:MAG: PAC2 family protein [archaeon]|nr:MAG: PAC2 family protein [archaeon]
MWIDFEKTDGVQLNAPAIVVAVSTSMPQYRALYSQAREVATYMLAKMKFERIATLRSSSFPPEVLVRDEGISSLPSCGFHLHRGKRDIVLFAGDTSPMEDQYEFAQFLLGYAQELGVKDLFSIGARWAENPVPAEAEPQLSGFATDEEGVRKLADKGIRILKEEPAPFFSSMIVALAKERSMLGYKLSVDHGEPSPHPRSVAKILGALAGLAGFEVELKELSPKAGASASEGKRPERGIYQ